MKWLKKVAATPLTSIANVIDSITESTNDRTNAPSIHAVRESINNNWLSIYPVGSIYMSVNNVDPSLVFGGTWSQIKDKFLLACGDTYNNGATGGSATHTLTVNEMPSHNHALPSFTSAKAGTEPNIGSGSLYSIEEYTVTGNVTNAGGGAAHNNMPPYIAVNVWVRTA